MNPLLRSITACNSAVLPGGRVALRIGTSQVGWVRPDIAGVLEGFAEIRAVDGGLLLDEPGALPAIGRVLAERGLCRFRNEAFDVRDDPEGPVLAQLDRGCLMLLGVGAQGVHLDGVVRAPDGLRVWIARRAMSKALDPGKLDHLVAGGVPAGLSPAQTLVKEAAEEAALPAELASQARAVGRFTYAMDRPEGLRRDVIHCYELELPEEFVPTPADGEVEGFALWRLDTLLEAARDGTDFKFNVVPVLVRLFLRHGAIHGSEAEELRRALSGE
jgi:8-oxo-dGTP pyrophosphatase MutT (NUDIX family)